MKQYNQNIKMLTAGLVLFTLLLIITGCNENAATISKKTDAMPMSTIIKAVNSKTLYAEAGGRKIAYRSIGEGDPIILCQRFRGNLDDWDPAFLDALAEKHQVITFDYSGFGLSTGAPPGDILGFAKDVKDLAETLGIKKFVVGGWSFGGAAAQIVMTEFPELVSHAILLGTRAPGSFEYPPEKIFLETSAKPQNDFEDEVILFFEPASSLSRAAAKLSHDRIAERINDKDVYIRPELWQFYQKGLEDFVKDPYNARQKITTTKTPILVVTADHEVVFPAQNWFDLNRKLPTAQIIVIPQAGHGPHHQHPELIAGYIKQFIANNKK